MHSEDIGVLKIRGVNHDRAVGRISVQLVYIRIRRQMDGVQVYDPGTFLNFYTGYAFAA